MVVVGVRRSFLTAALAQCSQWQFELRHLGPTDSSFPYPEYGCLKGWVWTDFGETKRWLCPILPGIYTSFSDSVHASLSRIAFSLLLGTVPCWFMPTQANLLSSFLPFPPFSFLTEIFCFAFDLVETPPQPVAPHGLEFITQPSDPHQFFPQDLGLQAGAAIPGHRKLTWSES